MNANELAIELERYLKGEEYDRLVWEIPDLLRQQQAEIEALKTKTLTDEEIYAEMVKCIDSPESGHEFRYKDFARAILRKAQEK